MVFIQKEAIPGSNKLMNTSMPFTYKNMGSRFVHVLSKIKVFVCVA